MTFVASCLRGKPSVPLRQASNLEPEAECRTEVSLPIDMSPLLGAHMSVAGGLPLAVDRAMAHGCEAFQIFSKNASRWVGRPVLGDEVQAFRSRLRAAGIGPVFSHASYLINLAAENPELRQMSVAAMTDELDRAEALGLDGVVLHPGCYTSGNASEGLRLVAAALLEILRSHGRGRTTILLENTAGQGTALGATFDELASIIARADGHPRIGVCLDTCHLLAAGYDIVSADGYESTFSRFSHLVGMARLKLLHLNDSKRPCGSHVDRHEHIGKGFAGLDAFRRIVNDQRFRRLPMLLETPKDESLRRANRVHVDRFDRKNLRTLRSLIGRGQESIGH
jgi:deoxyribonuclease IV